MRIERRRGPETRRSHEAAERFKSIVILNTEDVRVWLQDNYRVCIELKESTSALGWHKWVVISDYLCNDAPKAKVRGPQNLSLPPLQIPRDLNDTALEILARTQSSPKRRRKY